jgi:hypothetical protein
MWLPVASTSNFPHKVNEVEKKKKKKEEAFFLLIIYSKTKNKKKIKLLLAL